MVAIAETIEKPLTDECVAALDLPPDAPVHIGLERSPHQAFGDYRLDLRRASIAASRRLAPVDWESLADSLRRLEPVQEALSIPPRVYLRFTTTFLLESVRRAVEELQPRPPVGPRSAQVVTVGGESDSGAPATVHEFRVHLLAAAVANLFEAMGRAVQRQPDPDEAIPFGDVSVAPGLLVGGKDDDIAETHGLLRSLSLGFRNRWPVDPAKPASVSSPARVYAQLGRAFATYSILRIPRTHQLVLDEPHLWRQAWPRFARILRVLEWCDDHRSGTGGAVIELTPEAETRARAVLLAINHLPDAARVAAERFQPAAFVQALEDVARALDLARDGGPVPVEIRELGSAALRRGLTLLDIPVPSV